ncbi:MAG: EamA family transporter [Methanotrichaceae archaeon]|nr:EamA family transporter [Methanotrichaceae archaeon]
MRNLYEVWLFYAIMGMLSFSFAGVLDKLILTNFTEDSKAYVLCQVMVQQVFTIPILLLMAPEFVFPSTLIAIAAGAIQVLPAIYYLRALQLEDVSRVSALEYFYPIPVFFGTTLLLGETLALKDYVGSTFLLLGVFLASYRHENKICLKNFSPAVKPFVVYLIFAAIYYITIDGLLESVNEWHIYAWSSQGMMIAGFPLLVSRSVRKEFRDFFFQGPRAVSILIFEEGFQFLGIIFFLFACALGSAALVTSVGALQPITTLFLVLGLGLVKPRLRRDLEGKTDGNSVIHKSLSFLIIAAGIYFIC